MASARELVLTAHAQLALLRARRRLRREPAGHVVVAAAGDAAERKAGVVALDGPAKRAVRELERAVLRAARRGLFRPQCLVQAMALQSMLESRGLTGGRVRVGVNLAGDTFAAHAWVEYGDLVLGDTAEHVREYVPLSGARVQPLR
jgi:hypothetical protein